MSYAPSETWTVARQQKVLTISQRSTIDYAKL